MKLILCLSALALCLGGCMSSTPPKNSSPLTQGSVQLYLKKGLTTKAEVLEKFGSPNVTTRDGQGREVWSYQKHATSDRSVSAAAGAAGPFVTGVAGGGAAASSRVQSSQTMTLIIKFNSNDVVDDFESRYSSF
jgi:outer membrane protein assembly factor BamE (lipoprotein component of BamABCDE complex)